MNRFGNGDHRWRQPQYAIGSIAAERSGTGTLLKRGALIAAMLTLGGCSWFSNDEPAFPPTSGGPSIATVPDGLPGDSANAQYSDQELRALLGSAPRPLPPPPAEPKAADTGAPGATPDATSNDGTAPAPTANAQPSPTAPAGTVPAPAVPDAAKNNPSDYPDINTVPMQRPTPVPDAEQPNANQPNPDQPADEQKPKQSSMLVPQPRGAAQGHELLILTTAGSSPAAPADLSPQTAQSLTAPSAVTGADDTMFSKPVLPPYTGYDQTQKQPQGVPAQSIYRSPYAGPTQLGQPAGDGGSLYYASQSDTGAQITTTPGGRPVGLVYFGIGSTGLGGADRQVLRQIADLQRAYGGVIRIVGHASSRTENMTMDQHRKTNTDIAAARAKAVAEQLVRYGVRPLFVQIAGVSDSQPLYPEIMPAGEAANRRAEVYLSSN
ncbi:MAG TPA: OmpA family protein [Dongiaceae bacterium]|nr:OmpA family protein [Dongiaceae bacterium]